MSAAELFTERRYERKNVHGTWNPLDIATSIYFVWLAELGGPALALAMVGNVFKPVREGSGIHDII
jgi:hypothetical protein